jgi:hypothetical protein
MNAGSPAHSAGTELFPEKCRDFRKRLAGHAGKIKAACPEHNLSFIKVNPHVQITGYNPRFYNSGFKYPCFPNMISKPFNQDLTNFTLTTKSFNSMCVALHFEYSRAFARREEAKWNKLYLALELLHWQELLPP